jgi:hypothetical protein
MKNGPSPNMQRGNLGRLRVCDCVPMGDQNGHSRIAGMGALMSVRSSRAPKWAARVFGAMAFDLQERSGGPLRRADQAYWLKKQEFVAMIAVIQ